MDDFDNMLCERTQTQRPHVISFDLYEISTNDKYLETESKLVIAMVWEERELV